MPTILVKPTGPVTPGALAPLHGGKIAKKAPVLSAFVNAARMPWYGRKILGTVGVHGAGAWQVPSTDGDGTVTQDYPKQDDARVVLRFKHRITLGYFPAVDVLWQPSGGQQKYDILTAQWWWDNPPAGGDIHVLVDWPSATDVSGFVSPTPAISKKQYYGEETGASAAWMTIGRSSFWSVPSVGDISEIIDWTEPQEVTITITYYGGVRVHEVIVWDCPYSAVFGISNSQYEHPYDRYVDGQGDPAKVLPYSYPTTGLMSDASFSNVEYEHLFGPSILGWGTWDETNTSVASTDTNPVDITSTTWTSIWDQSSTLWADDIWGFSTAAGGDARTQDLSGEMLELRDSDGVIPVTVWVYGKTSSSPCTVRVQSSIASWVDVSITSTSYAWHSSTGELRCGIGAEDPTVCVPLGKVGTGGDTLSVRAISVYHDHARYDT